MILDNLKLINYFQNYKYFTSIVRKKGNMQENVYVIHQV